VAHRQAICSNRSRIFDDGRGIGDDSRVADNLDPALLTALGRVEFRPPASSVALSELASAAATPLPDDYLAFLGFANGAEGWIGKNYVQISSCAEAIETTRARFRRSRPTRGVVQ
jgi:hypothetical protein